MSLLITEKSEKVFYTAEKKGLKFTNTNFKSSVRYRINVENNFFVNIFN